MPKIDFEPASPDRLPLPARGQVDYWDGSVPGLGLRVSQGGAKSWVAMIQKDGRKQRLTFGAYPELSLDAARRLLGALQEPDAPAARARNDIPSPRRQGRPRKRVLVPSPQARHDEPATLVPSLPQSGLEAGVLFERAPCALIVLAADRIRRVNSAAATLLAALSIDQLIDQPIETVLHPADRARFAVQYLGKDLERRTKPRFMRLRLVRFDGTVFGAEIAGGTIAGPDGADRILVLSDRSEDDQAIATLRHAIERGDAASEAKSSFLATLSHELRTPISAVLGTLRLLLETDLDPTQHRHAEIATRAADALLEVLRDASDIARIEAGKLELRAAPFDIRTQVESAVALFAASAQEKNVELRLEIGADVPRRVEGDSGRLRQVLLNLVSNALKFTDAGSVVVGVTAHGVEDGRILLRYEVRDTGIGIPADKRARLFMAHGRQDRPASKPRPGAGLGLSISQALIGLMGGTIGFDSEYGKGSRFYFTVALPLSESAETEPAETRIVVGEIGTADVSPTRIETELARPHALPPRPIDEVPAAGTDRRRYRILLCEDDDMLREVMLAMLRDRPYGIDVVTRGENAVERVRQGDFDLVLMDVTLPGIDGLEATRLIRALPGTPGQVPILALTARIGAEERQRCLDAGMNDYLPKPVSRQALVAAIGSFLKPEEPETKDPMTRDPPPDPATPPAPSDGAAAILDRTTLEQLIQDIGAETLRTLIIGMIEETELRIERMAQKYAAEDWPELNREAHSLKGAARSYGAPGLAELAYAIEHAAEQRRTADLAAPMAALPALTRTTMDAFRKLLGA